MNLKRFYSTGISESEGEPDINIDIYMYNYIYLPIYYKTRQKS